MNMTIYDRWLLFLAFFFIPSAWAADIATPEKGQSNTPSALQQFIGKRMESHKAECGNIGTTKYLAREIDLNAKIKTILVEYQSCLCGTGGCDAELFIEENGQWRPLQETWDSLKPLNEIHDGWKDFAVYGHSSACCGGLTIYRWDRNASRYQVFKKDTYVNDTTVSQLLKESDDIVTKINAGRVVSIEPLFIAGINTAVFVALSPPENERLMENYARIAQHLNRKDDIAKLAKAGGQAYPEKGIYQVLLAEVYAEEGRPLQAHLAARRALNHLGLSPSDAEKLKVLSARVQSAADQEAKRLLSRSVAAKAADQNSKNSFLLFKSGVERRFDLIILSHDQIEDISSFQVGNSSDKDFIIQEIKATAAIWPGPSVYDLVSVTLRWEKTGKSREQHEATFFFGVDNKTKRLMSIWHWSINGGFAHRIYRNSPYLFQWNSWKILSWPSDPSQFPVLKEERCRFEGNPINLTEGGWTEYIYNRSFNSYDGRSSSGVLKKCSLGDLPPKALW